MPDIGMCTDDRCPARGICYRYMAVPTPKRQNYGGIPLRPAGAKKCDAFWPVCEASSAVKPEADCNPGTNPGCGCRCEQQLDQRNQ